MIKLWGSTCVSFAYDERQERSFSAKLNKPGCYGRFCRLEQLCAKSLVQEFLYTHIYIEYRCMRYGKIT